MAKICRVDGCPKPTAAESTLCAMHRGRWQRNGSFAITRRPNGTGNVNAGGYIDGMKHGRREYEHVAVAEKALGKPLPKGACVHHHNEDRADNRNCNLVICPDEAYHRLLHIRMKALAACGNAGWRKCNICKIYDDPESLKISRRGTAQRINVRHAECERSRGRARYKRRAST